ncbi:AAA family ATPase [Isoptericola halotolerans]|uniref:AAA family ATPase n=1 Tax=Isoptericola halotolerans TaxID=300560 RepID=UPI00388E1BCF
MRTGPWVVLMTGPPGSGKSTTAAAFARSSGAALLDQDSMTNPLVDVVADLVGADDYADPRLATLVREARYSCVLRAAGDCARAGVPSVLVAPFSAERADVAAWDRLANEVASVGGRPVLAWLRIAPEELARRLLERRAARDAGKTADVGSYVAGLDLDAPVGPYVELDASMSVEAQVARLEATLRSSR